MQLHALTLSWLAVSLFGVLVRVRLTRKPDVRPSKIDMTKKGKCTWVIRQRLSDRICFMSGPISRLLAQCCWQFMCMHMIANLTDCLYGVPLNGVSAPYAEKLSQVCNKSEFERTAVWVCECFGSCCLKVYTPGLAVIWTARASPKKKCKAIRSSL